MRFFLNRLTLFLVSLLLISIIFDFLISNKLKQSQTFALGESFIWKNIFDGKINDDLLIYGSSRAWVHFDPQIMQDKLETKVYNLGIDGHSFWLQFLRHKTLLKYNEKPKSIILSVGIFTFSKRKDLYNKEQFLPYIFNKDIYCYTSSYNGFNIFEYTIPLYRYLGKRDLIYKTIKELKKDKVYRIKGFKASNRTWNNDFNNAKLKMGSYNAVKDEATVNLFQSFMEYCKNEKINVIIVYSPEFVEGQNFVSNRDEIIETFKYYSKFYDVPFLDYSNDSISNNRNLFYNSMHLNSKGSRQFTMKLVKDLEKYNFMGIN